MRAEITKIVVTDSVLFGATGDVGRWARAVERNFTRNAIEEAPTGATSGRVNKSRANAAYPVGSLKASISGEVTRIGVRHLQTIISVDVPYALYVIKGTGPIFSRSARVPAGTRDESGRGIGGQFAPIGWGGDIVGGMYLPGNPGWGKARIRQHVSGQHANPFLDFAFARTAARHPSLRGMIMLGTRV